MGNFTIDDSDDGNPIDTSYIADGSVILEDEDGNEYTIYVTRSVKKKQLKGVVLRVIRLL